MNKLNEDSLQYILYTIITGHMTVALENIPKYNSVNKVFNKIFKRKIIIYLKKISYIKKYRIKYYTCVLEELKTV